MSNVSITAPNTYVPSASTTAGSYYSTSTTSASSFWGTNTNLLSTASNAFLWPGSGSSSSMWYGATSSNMWSSNFNSSFTCATDAEFEGDIKWKGRSLGRLLETIEDRLAILQEPTPEKLEKFAALKKAYEHYKFIEKLINEE